VYIINQQSIRLASLIALPAIYPCEIVALMSGNRRAPSGTLAAAKETKSVMLSMRMRSMRAWSELRILGVGLLLPALISAGSAQTGTAGMSGQVTDSSRAAIPGATVTLTTAGQSVTTKSSGQGLYQFSRLTPGKCRIEVTAPGFSPYAKDGVAIDADKVQRLDITLSIEVVQQNVVVTDQGPTVDTTPENNSSKIVISGKGLQSLSDDPDELAADLQALAGLSAGPNPGQTYIDGFTTAQPPPKSAIREIRINRNPFSAEYDKLGYGRIEIVTKPGAEQWHGNMRVMGNDAAFNSRNPFLHGAQPGYHSILYDADIGGALGKKASLFLDILRRDTDSVSVIDTPGDPAFGVPAVNEAVPNRRSRTVLNPRIDYQISANNTLTARYQDWRTRESNDGLGQFSLPSLGYDSAQTEHTVQFSDTQSFGATVVNEARFQFERGTNDQKPRSTLPTLNVEGYFNGGGNSQGTTINSTNHYEIQNHTSIAHAKHLLKFGARLRAVQDESYTTSGFNGTFIFNSAADYQAGNPYQFTETILRSGGMPSTRLSLFEGGLYLQEDWRVRPNLTLSGGLRFETQSGIRDHGDWAPRVGVSWGLGHEKAAPKTVLRAGWGIFYDRFTDDLLLNARRLNGETQQSYVIYGTTADPLSFYPGLPSPAELQNAPTAIPTSYRVERSLQAPYAIETSVALERQFGEANSLSIAYINSRGNHQFFTNNVNAPEPSTYSYLDPTAVTGADRPNGVNENIFEYESQGLFKQGQLMTSLTFHAGRKLDIFAHYALGSASSDAVGANSFPSNPYDILQDYGRAPFDFRHTLFVGGMISLPHGVRLSPFFQARSGRPYNIILSQDLNGSAVLNQRPAFASELSDPADVVTTSFGSFDTTPVADERPVPFNYLTGPGYFDLNLRVGKRFSFGRQEEAKPGEGTDGPGNASGHRRPATGNGPGQTNAEEKRYHIELSVSARNLFNVVNRGTPNGILNPPHLSPTDPEVIVPAAASPLFGESNSLANGSSANRVIYLQGTFSF